MGADGWLTKPVQRSNLLALVGVAPRPEPKKAPLAAPVTAARRVARRPHVLVVDDDRDVLEYCRSVLLGAGAVVDAIQDASGLLEMLPAGGTYDLVLLDIFMPEVNGIDLLRRFSADVRNCTSRLYIISSADDEALRAEAKRCGADGYLTKPLHRKALLDLLAA
jgi:CheY-like chemotaxis protein